MRRKARLTLDQWREKGRPEWVLVATEDYGGGRISPVYYRPRVPAYLDLDVIIGAGKDFTELRAGLLLPDQPPPEPIQPAPLIRVEHEKEDLKKGHVSEARKPLLWDRTLLEYNAQKFSPETEDPDYVDPESPEGGAV